jgi:hypothetical protein
MSERTDDGDVVEQAVFYALFKVVEVDELMGPDKAVEWARSVVDDDDLRRAFAREIHERAAEQPDEP